MVKGLELSVPHPDLQRWERLEVDSISTGQWLDQVCLRDEASIKTQKDWARRAPGLANTWRCGEGGACGEGMEALDPFPSRALCISSIGLFLGYILL